MAQNAATLRLMSDLREMQKDAPEGASAAPMNEDNIFVWTATIFGPADTPWEGGIFSLRMTFCDQYPDKPPKVCFSLYIFLFSPLIGLGAGAVHDKGLSSQCVPRWYPVLGHHSEQMESFVHRQFSFDIHPVFTYRSKLWKPCQPGSCRTLPSRS